MGMFIKAIGCAFLTAGALVVLLNQIGVYMEHGWSGLQELISPRNMWRYATTVMYCLMYPFIPWTMGSAFASLNNGFTRPGTISEMFTREWHIALGILLIGGHFIPEFHRADIPLI